MTFSICVRETFEDDDGEEQRRFGVAGNLLTGEAVIDAVAETYEAGDRAEPLPKRLVDALEAGHEAGGDKREDLPVQSAALLVETTEDRPLDPAAENLRVDATDTPIADLWETYELAVRAHEDAMAKYEDDYEADEAS